MHRPPLLAVFLLVALLLPSVTLAQNLSTTGQEALERFQQDDIQGAIALLEPLRGRGELTPVDTSLLGSLYLEVARAADALGLLRPLADAPDADAAVLYTTGRAAYQAGQVESAVIYFQRSVDKVPVSPAGRELGLIHGRQGRLGEAYRLLLPWVQSNPDDLEARTAAAAAGIQLRRASEVEILVQGLPDTAPNAVLRAQLAEQQNKPTEIAKILEPHVETAPPAVRKDILRLLADAYINVGRAEDAVKLLRGVDETESRDPRILLLLSEALYRSGDTDGAVAALAPVAKPLLERDEIPKIPVILQALLDYGRMLVAAGRHDEALPYLRKATELDPKRQLGWKALGDAFLAAGRRDEAEGALAKFRQLAELETERRKRDEILAKDPSGAAVLRAEAMLREGDSKGALEVLRSEILLSPRDMRLRVAEVRTLVSLSRMQEAFQAAEKTLQVFPDHPDAVYQIGAVRLGLNQRAAAEKDLRRALEIQPEHVAALSDLAVLLHSQGRLDEARSLVDRLLAVQPENPTGQQLKQRLDGR